MIKYHCIDCGREWNDTHHFRCCYDGIVIMTECCAVDDGIHADIDPSGACCADEQPAPVTILSSCPKCKGKGVIITDILNGATRPCECRKMPEKPKEALATIGQLMGVGFPQSLRPGEIIPIPPSAPPQQLLSDDQIKQIYDSLAKSEAAKNANSSKG